MWIVISAGDTGLVWELRLQLSVGDAHNMTVSWRPRGCVVFRAQQG
jgi:hypothetical protein